MRRLCVYLALVAVAVGLLFLLRHRKRQFIAAQVLLLQSNEPDRATAARKTLQRIGRSAVRPVCALLEHKNADVRARAALTLANIGHPAACGPLMAAAKRGDFPAADALEFMKHPRAGEARASLNCTIADEALADLERHLPMGGARPTDVWARVRPPARPFEPARRSVLQWPHGGHAPGWLESQPAEIGRWYGRALAKGDFLDPLIGSARLLRVCGFYDRAADRYSQALELDPDNQTARTGRDEAERFIRLKQNMNSVTGRHLRLRPILTHPTWRDTDAIYYVAISTQQPSVATMRYLMPKIFLFRATAEGIEKVGDTVPGFTPEERAAHGPYLRAHAGIVERGPSQVALLVVIRPLDPSHPSNNSYDVVLYRLSPTGLMKVLQEPSCEMPWVGDLDEDGDAEIVTWRWSVYYPESMGKNVPWPIVRTRVGERFDLRTEQFPSLFEPVASWLRRYEMADAPSDPKVSDRLARAYEILGNTSEAIAAYERAEAKYLARGDTDAADTVKQRRLRLQAQVPPP